MKHREHIKKVDVKKKALQFAYMQAQIKIEAYIFLRSHMLIVMLIHGLVRNKHYTEKVYKKNSI